MSKKIILLVDDDPILGGIVKKRIEEDGYVCLWEKDGNDGLAKMREVRPDLLLLDIVMPNMNGYEVLEAINAEPELLSIPVVVISNSGQPVEIQKILGLGAKDFIVKAHFSPEEVMVKIAKIIGPGNEAEGAELLSKKSPESTKILIIEDDDMLSEIASDRFRHDGYQVFCSNDGRSGIEKAAEVRPDIILLDIIMPGMSGFEVLKALKDDPSLKSLPVVIFSNLAQNSDILEGHRLGAIDFLVKANYTPAQLVERVKKILATL